MSETPLTPEQEARQKKLVDMMFAKHLHITIRVIVITVVPLLVLGGLGYLAAQWLDTTPFLLVLGVVVSSFLSPAINFIVFHKLTK